MTLAAVTFKGLALGGGVGSLLEGLQLLGSKYEKISNPKQIGYLTIISTIAFTAITILAHLFAEVSRDAFLGGLVGLSLALLQIINDESIMTPFGVAATTVISSAVGCFAGVFPAAIASVAICILTVPFDS